MSQVLKSGDSGEQPEPARAAFRGRSDLHGVHVVLKGWKRDLNKVKLTKTLIAGGIGLNEAARLTGRILDGFAVEVRLAQFVTVSAARAEFSRIGISEVSGPEAV